MYIYVCVTHRQTLRRYKVAAISMYVYIYVCVCVCVYAYIDKMYHLHERARYLERGTAILYSLRVHYI